MRNQKKKLEPAHERETRRKTSAKRNTTEKGNAKCTAISSKERGKKMKGMLILTNIRSTVVRSFG
jgi:hypothetical protein